MKKTAIILALLFAAGAAFAQEVDVPPAAEVTLAPKIVCDEPTYDFGEADSSDTIEHTFVLKNEGNIDLEITRVRPACGCTAANLSDQTIPPGGEARIQTRLSLRGRKGRQRKSITVESNDPQNPRFMLFLEGVASQELSVDPSQVIFGRISRESDQEKTVMVTARGTPFVVSQVTSTIDQFEPSVETIEAGKQYRIHVKLNSPVNPGRHRGYIRIASEDPGQADLNVPVTATVVGPLVVAPQEIVLADQGGQPVTRYVVIRPGEVSQFDITSIEPPAESIIVKSSPIAGNGHRLQLDNITPSDDLDGKSLRILTTAEGMEEILIPFKIIRPQ